MKERSLRCWVLLGLVLFAPILARAHPALFTSAQVYIQPDGRFQIFTTFDLLAFTFQKSSLEITDPPMNALLDGPEDVLAGKIAASRAYFLSSVKVRSNRGPATITRLQFPTLAEVETWKSSGRKPRLPVVANVELDGKLPPTATSVQFQFPFCLATVVLTVDRPGEEGYDEPVNPGSESSVIPLDLDRSAVAAAVPAAAPAGPRNDWRRSLLDGLKSMRMGAGHLLFLLAVFLPSVRLKPLLWQIAAFLLACSITLALAACGVCVLPPSVIEPAIDLTLILVGVQNLFPTQVGPARVLLVFACGLVHGFGLGAVFRASPAAVSHFPGALIGFGVGFALGLLGVIFIALPVAGRFRMSPRYRTWIAVPGSLGIVAIAACWLVQRIVSLA